MNREKKSETAIFVLLGFTAVFYLSCTRTPKKITIEDDHLRYEIAKDGRNLHFIDKTNGADYLYTDSVSYCASIIQDDKEVKVSSVKMENNLLKLGFGASGVSVEISIEKAGNRIMMEITAVKGIAESLTFLNVPLKLEGMLPEWFLN